MRSKAVLKAEHLDMQSVERMVALWVDRLALAKGHPLAAMSESQRAAKKVALSEGEKVVC